jgi:hypothetical protein
LVVAAYVLRKWEYFYWCSVLVLLNLVDFKLLTARNWRQVPTGATYFVDGNKRIHVGVYNIKKELPGTMSELCKIDPF